MRRISADDGTSNPWRGIEIVSPGAFLTHTSPALIAWDDRLTGFGVRVQPSGIRSCIVNYRAGGGGRKAANRRLVIGRHGRVTPEQARRGAHETLGKVAAGEDPGGDQHMPARVPCRRCAKRSRSLSGKEEE